MPDSGHMLVWPHTAVVTGFIMQQHIPISGSCHVMTCGSCHVNVIFEKRINVCAFSKTKVLNGIFAQSFYKEGFIN